MGFHRFLHNSRVTVEEMKQSAFERTCTQAQGKDLLLIQDTTTIRSDGDSKSLCLHAGLVVDETSGHALGLGHISFYNRRPKGAGGTKEDRSQKAHADKASARWSEGIIAAQALCDAGARNVTVIADREGDIYEDLVRCQYGLGTGVDLLIRAAQNRRLSGSQLKLMGTAQSIDLGQELAFELPSAPGRKARKVVVSIGFCSVEILRPGNRRPQQSASLPEKTRAWMVVAKELNPPAGAREQASWVLLSTRPVETYAQARRCIHLYRRRWLIEQLFRTFKKQGFDIKRQDMPSEEPFRKLATIAIIAAITVMQLVLARDGSSGEPLEQAFDATDIPVLEAVNKQMEGATVKQQNPHSKGTLARAAWIIARLGGWDPYYGKPGPIVMYDGLKRYNAVRYGYAIRNV